MRTPAKGWGLFAAESIPKGAFVAEYLGEIISTEEARRRWLFQVEHKLPNYIICVREHGEHMILRTLIDPQLKGNAARFINHSCTPNLAFHTVRGPLAAFPSAALFAVRSIPPGEELSFDYGDALGASVGNGGACRRVAPLAEQRIPCRCDSSECRGFLPNDAMLV
ncbi:hypothetical protein DFJ73DRAFT_873977 [Zopfochytrium polystomum]|nr:hypothetical protein DFJ73DRAFT_873977 [Zopfochytrium polystomum]